MSPPAKTPLRPVIIEPSTVTTPSLISMPSTPSRKVRSASWPSAKDQRVGLQLLELAGGLREPGLVKGHLLDDHLAVVDVLDRREPLEQDALLQGLFDLEVVGRHLVAGAAVDDDRLFRAQPLGRAGGVDGGVAAAVDDDPRPSMGFSSSVSTSRR
jgi:hypothetical protein